MGTLGCLELRFLYQKYDFCTSGLMNVRLSVHCSLKRTKHREDSSVRLPVRLSVHPQHNTFENFPCGPEMPFEARSCNLLLNHEPLNSKCLKYISNKALNKRKTRQIINIVC